ncbi:unnamed protein product [Phytomonas sp. EM1]|nr:unnamed protein product [Phytomonas sp. EM1]|eukprot:CCW64224.1 unnamed protein product [Phytomonas sp. isolate EM1]
MKGLSRSFITTNIVGGLGNQLFLVANLLATARRNNIPAVLPRLSLSSSCDAPRPTYWSSIFESLESFGVEYVDEYTSFDDARMRVVVQEVRPAAPIFLTPGSCGRNVPCCFDMVGFFQSESFFRDFPIIKEIVPHRLHQLAMTHLRANYSYGSDYPHTVGIHLRRGDYTKMTDVFEQLDLGSYYDPAICHILGGLLMRELHKRAPCRRNHSSTIPPSIQLLFFCEEEREGQLAVNYFRSKYLGLHVTHVHPSNEKQAPLASNTSQPREVLELIMLAHCDDVVMANSTFSWWGAYLNKSVLRRVVAPSKWFVQHPYPQSNHLYCDNWFLL